MRAAGEGRKSKFETTRLVGIGLMLSGILAFTFAVLGTSGAGATGAAKPAHNVIPTCQHTAAAGSPVAEVIQAGYNTGCNDTTTTTKPCTTTTTTTGPCSCTTTTTTEVDTTTTAAPTTTTSMGSTTSSTSASTTTSSTTSSTTTSTTIGPLTVTTDTSPVSQFNVTTTTGGKAIVVEGTTAVLAPPQIAVSPSSGVLPFTGSNTAPLVGLGIVLVGAGFGLSRRKRNLSD
jgi:LPXTG-motif cell wall-anchored protein